MRITTAILITCLFFCLPMTALAGDDSTLLPESTSAPSVEDSLPTPTAVPSEEITAREPQPPEDLTDPHASLPKEEPDISGVKAVEEGVKEVNFEGGETTKISAERPAPVTLSEFVNGIARDSDVAAQSGGTVQLHDVTYELGGISANLGEIGQKLATPEAVAALSTDDLSEIVDTLGYTVDQLQANIAKTEGSVLPTLEASQGQTGEGCKQDCLPAWRSYDEQANVTLNSARVLRGSVQTLLGAHTTLDRIEWRTDMDESTREWLEDVQAEKISTLPTKIADLADAFDASVQAYNDVYADLERCNSTGCKVTQTQE